jgi:membrane-associated phospholipid phosphatase
MRLVALITSAVAVLLVMVFYIDVPLAAFLQSLGLWQSLRSASITQAPVLLSAGTAAVVLGCCCLVFQLPFAKFCRSATLAGFATLLSYVLVRDILKQIFGRAFPYIVLGHGTDAFHWFSLLPTERSFPSTHAAELTAILAVFWIRHPRWKIPYVIVALVMNMTMMLGEWHFLSDIVAGMLVGTAAALLVMAMAKRVARRLPATERSQWNYATSPRLHRSRR